MADLKVSIAGVAFQNPIIAASGTFGFGREYAKFYPLSTLGGISCKGTTLKSAFRESAAPHRGNTRRDAEFRWIAKPRSGGFYP